MSEPVAQTAPRRAVPVDTRHGWMLLALLASALARACGAGLGALGVLLDSVLVAAACEVACGFARHARPTRSSYRESVLLGVLAVLWLPYALPVWAAGIATIVAIVSRRLVFGTGASPFHPAMLGCSLAMLAIAAARLPVAPDPAPVLTALVFAAGGLTLAAGRCIRWQVPLAFLLPVALGLIALSSGRPPAWMPLLPTLVLTAFFIATDPASGCMRPRARWWFGALAGALSTVALLALRGHAVYLGLSGAVLLANAVAPWLDRLADRAHVAATIKPSRA